MRLTLEEARTLYKQGALAKEIALREYSEGEILNDYTKVTTLPCIIEYTDTINLFAGLHTVYMQMSEGRIPKLTSCTVYMPDILISYPGFTPRTLNTLVGRVKIDNSTYDVYAGHSSSTWDGRLAFENDGVPCGSGITEHKWVFKEEGQATHFATHFWKELIQLELESFHTIEFEQYGKKI